MLALPGIVLLIALVLVRPQELTPLIPALEGVPLLYYALGLAVVGFLVDVLSRINTLRWTPITPFALAFLAWSFVTLAIRMPAMLWPGMQRMLICALLCLLIAHGSSSPWGLNVIAGAMLVCALFLSVVGIQQGITPLQCIEAEDPDGKLLNRPLGRECAERDDCYRIGGKSGYHYDCEAVGWFGITTVEDGRARYIGTLHDPNELALTVGCSLPMAYAMRREKPGARGTTLAVVATLLVVLCIIFTGSRGGQLVALAMFGTYFLVRAGTRGLVAAGLLAVPAIIYGGRSSERAAASTVSRIECWYQGADLAVRNPVFGIGHHLYDEHHDLTAHNAYLLAGAEGGLLGMMLFVGVLYAAAKIGLSGIRRYKDSDDPRRAWAIGLLAAIVGMSMGLFFLSFTYHEVLWLLLGITGAFYNVLRGADDGFRVTWRPRDFIAIASMSVGLLALLFVYTRAAVGG